MANPSSAAARNATGTTGDPLWYKDAVIYEVHVRAFHDASGDGLGDFEGLTQKLDYLKELGVTAIWLQPFYESPGRDDGYDIADYRKVNPKYGTLRDFRRFLDGAHARGLRVITELVVNHTSDQHEWFQRARTAPRGSAYRDYYVWSDTAAEYADARVIFKDFERSNWTWDPVAGQYFWHRFYSHQPDLNFQNPRVRKEILDTADFWLGMGVDGFRLDAVPYLYEEEGTSCENLPATHAFLRELRAFVEQRYPGRLLLAEANQWPDDAAKYLGQGDECHMAYHFPLMPRLFMAVRMEDRFPITEILEQTPPIPDSCQWALFLRNHDELTLEMVTDEERDYMYRVYAAEDRARINLGIRRRLAPLLGHNRRLIELMNALLLSMRGTPVIYYGDELGMGDNIYLGDRDGVRTPMQWSADRNAGFSRANPQRLYMPVIIDPEYHYESVNVDAQQANPSSLLWWMRRLLALRNRHLAFSRGSMTFVEADNHRVLAFVREYEGERVLVVANLSRFAQAVNLQLGFCSGIQPVEMFGNAPFPAISSEPYFLSMGPHAFFWFVLSRAPAADGPLGPPVVRYGRDWDELFNGRRAELEALLSDYIPARRWFGARNRRPRQVTLVDVAPLRVRGTAPSVFVVAQVAYDQGEPDRFVLLLSQVGQERAAAIERQTPWAIMAHLEDAAGNRSCLVDGFAAPEVSAELPEMFRQRTRLAGTDGLFSFTAEPAFRRLDEVDHSQPVVHAGEQSNTSVIYAHRYMFKCIRRLEAGPHPQVEMDRALAKSAIAASTPRLAGTLTYTPEGGEGATAGILEYVTPHQYDAWTFALEELGRLLEEVAANREPVPAETGGHPLDAGPTPARLLEYAGSWLEFATVLGARTGGLHNALASIPQADFAPERYTPFYQRALAQGFRTQARLALRGLRKAVSQMDTTSRVHADAVLAREPAILARLQAVAGPDLASKRIRGHGDLHLGQVLVNGREPLFIDFEGEPARSLGDRRTKRSPLRDAAGMVRSFDYVSRVALKDMVESQAAGQATDLEGWAAAWYRWTAKSFLDAYFAATAASGLLAVDPDERRLLFDCFSLDKALYELAYELDNRPGWVDIPLRGILQLVPEGTA